MPEQLIINKQHIDSKLFCRRGYSCSFASLLPNQPHWRIFRQDDLMPVKFAGLCPDFEKLMLNKFTEAPPMLAVASSIQKPDSLKI
jgi:hypothetical protein